ncbi:MAG: sugar phosphate isomerase/epimerase [Bacteroidales bacterium]|nr:sugar phosphate isomerase/epimerase [Bacteroidales bacterium]
MSNRRQFLKNLLVAGAGVGLLSGRMASAKDKRRDELFFDISLAEWSLHRTLRSGKMTNLDFPRVARERYDIAAIEYVSTLFKNTKLQYLSELRNISVNEEVNNVLIMVDDEGDLGDTDAAARNQAVENHFKWIETAKYLGCQTIRVNARGEGSSQEVAQAAIEGLSSLSERAAHDGINVVVENHGGYSSNGQWLAGVIRSVDMPNCGTLPDFGNFDISNQESYDRYKGIKELMPYAKGVSAKTYDFDGQGNETTMDFRRILQIVQQASYHGYLGIEYEGSRLSEHEGILASKKLLERVGKELG